jgi:hypothetical protein
MGGSLAPGLGENPVLTCTLPAFVMPSQTCQIRLEWRRRALFAGHRVTLFSQLVVGAQLCGKKSAAMEIGYSTAADRVNRRSASRTRR